MGGEQSRVEGGSGGGGGGSGGSGSGGSTGGRGSDGTAPGARRGSENNRPTSTSPRPSISSDADLPYISYTVNRPIGDSPKHTSRGLRGLRGSGGGGSPRRSRYHRGPHAHTRPQEVVVVREATTTTTTVDPELARLQSIPTFLPIMRGALTAPSARDPEVLERLDTAALVELCRRYQCHLHLAAATTTQAQDALANKIRDVESSLSTAVTNLTDRQKSYAWYAEKLGHVSEVSHALSRCHASLNLILESLDALNTALPINERLEPFVWTTG
ncbi:BLOC-1-related complex subunit 5-like [Scylla paramamosain]|uniref:BLOC-1-related complex subunit 5-like n=1 Tax=Scylla paramamosain TaxID=85552 RepID=UPI00308374F4